MSKRENNPNQRRDYRHFPAAYGELLMRFSDSGTVSVGPMSERDAEASRRDLYRFKTFLSHACDTDPSDAYARELHDAATRAIIRVEPIATIDDRGTHCVVLAVNPLVAAVEALVNTGKSVNE